MQEEKPASKDRSLERKAIFGIVCGTHLFNHFQSSMIGVLYPFMMKELGFGYVEIGILTAAYNMVGSLLQALYGFIAARVRRAVVLGSATSRWAFPSWPRDSLPAINSSWARGCSAESVPVPSTRSDRPYSHRITADLEDRPWPSIASQATLAPFWRRFSQAFF